MAIFKKDLLARYILAVLAFALFSLNVVTSSHFAPKTERQLITVNHQVRRVLMRAERENLRSSAASEEGTLINPPRQLGVVSPLLEIVTSDHKIWSAAHLVFEPERFVLESSPVLNL